jgi:two-component system phosphate regulon response regulator OmpR
MVLDVMLPGQNGISLTNELRGQVDLPILLLTALGESDDRVNGLAAGADDYLVKPFDPRELLLRIATILRRATPAVPSAGPLRFGPFTFDAEGGILRRGEERVHLTDAELSLLQVLAEQPGVPVGREELGRRGRMSGSDRAIDTQVARLRRKLEPDPRRPHHLLTKRGEGYVLKPGG